MWFVWLEGFHHMTCNIDGIHFVICQKIGNTRNVTMHGCTPKFFGIGVFIGCHFYQWGTRQKHLGSILLHNGVVRHAWHISTTSCCIAKDNRYGGNPLLRSRRHISESGTVVVKHSILIGKICATTLHQVDGWNFVFQSDFTQSTDF